MAIAGLLERRWPPAYLAELLGSDSGEVVSSAAVCLGLSGSLGHCAQLAPLLASRDERVAAAAEDALWNLWMRAGSPEGNARLADAVRHIRAGAFEAALQTLDRLAADEPLFAEVFHQRGIAQHLLERLDEAESSYREALRLNAQHFAAAAGLGHIGVERGDLAQAVHYYRVAMRINPRLTELGKAVSQIERAQRRRVVA